MNCRGRFTLLTHADYIFCVFVVEWDYIAYPSIPVLIISPKKTIRFHYYVSDDIYTDGAVGIKLSLEAISAKQQQALKSFNFINADERPAVQLLRW